MSYPQSGGSVHHSTSQRGWLIKGTLTFLPTIAPTNVSCLQGRGGFLGDMGAN